MHQRIRFRVWNMIYFLPALQLLFLLIAVSSKQCHEKNSIQILKGGIWEPSQTGYLYGTIKTPNFPDPFPTPFNFSYIIDASYGSDDSQINLYLTQMHLVRGVRFFQHPTLEICHENNHWRKQGTRQECRGEGEIKRGELQDLLQVSTNCPCLEIQASVPELYGFHYRTKDPFLFDVDFFCDCSKNHPGRYCEFSPHCDPENNVTFCHNGGLCRMFALLQVTTMRYKQTLHQMSIGSVYRLDVKGDKEATDQDDSPGDGNHQISKAHKIVSSGVGYCNCSGTGFSGAKCEKRNAQPKVSATTGCSPETSKTPCACRPSPKGGRVIPNDWVKYEAIIPIYQNYTVLRNQSTIGYVLQKNISRWFQSHNMSDLHNVLVNFNPAPQEKSYPQPREILIHFHGPYSLRDKIQPLLSLYIFEERETQVFRRQIPLNNNLVLHTMPRVEYKSIEVNKQSRVKTSTSVAITCVAITGTSHYYMMRYIRFRWLKDGLPVNTSIATRTRHITIGPTHNGNETMSHIMIDHVSPYDGGVYTCEVTDLEFGDQNCGTKEIEVALPPQIEIEPMSITLEKKEIEKGKVITCTDGSYSTYHLPNITTDFMWSMKMGNDNVPVTNDGMVVVEDIYPQGKILRILKAEHTESFTCLGRSKDGGNKEKVIKIDVLDSRNSPSCKEHWEPLLKQTEKTANKNNILTWEWTAANSVAMLPRPQGYIGYVQRRCVLATNGRVHWGQSDFSRCISERLKMINITLQHAKMGFGDWQATNGIKLMSQLDKYLNANPVLYPGEAEKIILIMDDLLLYVFEKGKIASSLLQIFYGTVVKLLKTSSSCVQEKALHILCKTIVDMAARGAKYAKFNEKDKLKPHIVSSEVFMVQTLAIGVTAKYRELSYTFPQKDAMTKNSTLSWLKDKLYVKFPLDSIGLPWDADGPMTYYLTIAAYKNLTSLLVPSESSVKRTNFGKRNFRTSIELISPVVQLSIPKGYYFPPKSHIKIHFNLSKEHQSHVSRSPMPSTPGSLPNTKGTFYVCGALNNSNSSNSTKTNNGTCIVNAIPMDVPHKSFVECQIQSKNSGIFGLLKVSNLEDEIHEASEDVPRIIIMGFSFCILCCILSAAVLCIYLRCRVSLNSLYALKLLDCLFIFCAVFIVLVGRTEMPSSSWLVWSATACSFLISSLSVQVSKTLWVFLMEATPNVSFFIFPWLKNVSQVSLLSAIIFSTVLPVWTATVAKIVGVSSSNESPFHETSFVFAVFVATVGLVVLAFLALYYKAVLKTKGELDRCRQLTGSANSAYASEMICALNYRKMTLNRSLCLTLIILIMTLGIVLYENLRQSVFIQCFLGLSATSMGIALLLSYVTQSEYPIYLSLCKPEKHLKRKDPEKDSFLEAKGSQRKLYAVSSEVTGNGSIVGTTGLLPPPTSILRNTSRQLGDESETLSVSTVEEQSLDTFSTEISFRAAPTLPLGNKVCTFSKRNNLSVRSTGSSTRSSNGSSCRRKNPRIRSSDGMPQPIRGHCLISSGDYIMPSVRNTGLIERPIVQTESSTTSSSSYNNYLPIHDPDDIQKKIDHDFSILLPMQDKMDK